MLSGGVRNPTPQLTAADGLLRRNIDYVIQCLVVWELVYLVSLMINVTVEVLSRM